MNGENGSPSSSKSNGGKRTLVLRSSNGKSTLVISEKTESKKNAAPAPPPPAPPATAKGVGNERSVRKNKYSSESVVEREEVPNVGAHKNKQPREVENLHVDQVVEFPKIFVGLSRKEKEEDFLAMKGTKLPVRTKKRSKTVERQLENCFPGMFLSDLSSSRYEVKEDKKGTRKPRRRGLKALEKMGSDSD